MRAPAVLALALSLLVTSASRPAWSAETAAGLATAAKKAFDAGEYDRAAELLERAYELKKAPPLLYNLGRAYLQGGRLELAVGAYRRYLEAAPKARDASSVKRTIAELEQRIAAETQLQEAAKRAKQRAEREAEASRRAERRAALAREREERTRQPSPVPWIVSGVGVVTAATAVPLWLIGSSAHDSAQQEQDAASADAHQERAQDFATAGNIVLIVGAAITAIGITWGLFELRRSQSPPTHGRVSFRVP